MDELEKNRDEVTRILSAINAGDRSAVDALIPLVYRELRTMAGRFLKWEHPDHTLQPTELVNEAYLRLLDQKRVPWQGKSHFFFASAHAMRRILVDHARAKLRKKRGERPQRVELTENLQISAEREGDVLALDEALEKLEKLDPRQARIVERASERRSSETPRRSTRFSRGPSRIWVSARGSRRTLLSVRRSAGTLSTRRTIPITIRLARAQRSISTGAFTFATLSRNSSTSTPAVLLRISRTGGSTSRIWG